MATQKKNKESLSREAQNLLDEITSEELNQIEKTSQVNKKIASRDLIASKNQTFKEGYYEVLSKRPLVIYWTLGFICLLIISLTIFFKILNSKEANLKSDLLTLNEVKNELITMVSRSAVSEKTMPPAKATQLTAEELAAWKCWQKKPMSIVRPTATSISSSPSTRSSGCQMTCSPKWIVPPWPIRSKRGMRRPT